jgi:hypothetical protein
MLNKKLIDFEIIFFKYIRAGNLILEETFQNPVFCFYFCYYNLKGNRIDFKKEKIIFYIRVF